MVFFTGSPPMNLMTLSSLRASRIRLVIINIGRDLQPGADLALDLDDNGELFLVAAFASNCGHGACSTEPGLPSCSHISAQKWGTIGDRRRRMASTAVLAMCGFGPIPGLRAGCGREDVEQFHHRTDGGVEMKIVFDVLGDPLDGLMGLAVQVAA